jgi:hypothetical protein
VGVLFFPNHQMAPAKGHIIFHQLSIGSSKQAYYFSETLNWLQKAGICFPNHQLASASRHVIFHQLPIGYSMRAYYFSPTINWLQQAVILFFPNHVISVTIIPLHLWPHSWGTISTVVAAT